MDYIPRLQGNIDGVPYDEMFKDMESAWIRFNELALVEAETGGIILEKCGHMINESCIYIQGLDWGGSE